MAFRYLLSWWYIKNTWLPSILQTTRLKISDTTNIMQMKSNPLVNGFSLTSLMSLMIPLSVDYFCHFQPCNMAHMTPLSKSQWNVVKCQNSEIADIFCSFYRFWQFYIWVFNLITQILVNFQIFASIFFSIVFTAVIFASSISSEIPIERLNDDKVLALQTP